jgi:4-amino-4-deoxychorismate lyase
MYQLIETIKVLNGQLQNLAYHNRRLNRARKELFNSPEEIEIAEFVKIPALANTGVYKCTVTYNTQITASQFQAYSIRTIKSLKVVTDNTIDYKYKYADRTHLNNLLEQKGECDEILIIKNGMVTDTSFSNVIFYKQGKWFTPYSPLLKGTKREKLLQQQLIEEIKITVNDLGQFEKVGLINAMLEIADIMVDMVNLKL